MRMLLAFDRFLSKINEDIENVIFLIKNILHVCTGFT